MIRNPMLSVIQSFSHFVSMCVLGYMHFWDNTGWGCEFYGNELYKIQIMSLDQQHFKNTIVHFCLNDSIIISNF